MNQIQKRVVKFQGIKPLYDFLREDLDIKLIDIGGNLVYIFDAEDSDILTAAKELCKHKSLTTIEHQKLLEKIKVVES